MNDELVYWTVDEKKLLKRKVIYNSIILFSFVVYRFKVAVLNL